MKFKLVCFGCGDGELHANHVIPDSDIEIQFGWFRIRDKWFCPICQAIISKFRALVEDV